jgi:hypothetical protein
MADDVKSSRSPASRDAPTVEPGADERSLWLMADGEPVSCNEKLKVLNENLDEMREVCQEALEDAILMGCDEARYREILHHMVEALANPYRK